MKLSSLFFLVSASVLVALLGSFGDVGNQGPPSSQEIYEVWSMTDGENNLTLEGKGNFVTIELLAKPSEQAKYKCYDNEYQTLMAEFQLKGGEKKTLPVTRNITINKAKSADKLMQKMTAYIAS